MASRRTLSSAKTTAALVVIVAVGGVFAWHVWNQVKGDKEFAGHNKQNIEQTASFNNAHEELEDARASGDTEKIAKAEAKVALEEFFKYVEEDKIYDIDIVKLKTNKNIPPALQQYCVDFVERWCAEMNLRSYENEKERYDKLKKEERKTTQEPVHPGYPKRNTSQFIKNGAVAEFYGDQQTPYAEIVPYYLIKNFDSHYQQKSMIAVYADYIDVFIAGNGDLTKEKANVLCLSVYARYEAALKDKKNGSAEVTELAPILTDIKKGSSPKSVGRA